MAEVISRYKLSHWIVRIIVLVNLAHLALGELFPAYYLTFGRTLNRIIVAWFAVSSLLLPLYVIGEVFWMLKNSLQERKAILIDAVFATAWFVTLWGLGLYALMRTVWL